MFNFQNFCYTFNLFKTGAICYAFSSIQFPPRSGKKRWADDESVRLEAKWKHSLLIGLICTLECGGPGCIRGAMGCYYRHTNTLFFLPHSGPLTASYRPTATNLYSHLKHSCKAQPSYISKNNYKLYISLYPTVSNLEISEKVNESKSLT